MLAREKMGYWCVLCLVLKIERDLKFSALAALGAQPWLARRIRELDQKLNGDWLLLTVCAVQSQNLWFTMSLFVNNNSNKSSKVCIVSMFFSNKPPHQLSQLL